jgi:tetratricopeptide (TPR) repeat protein
MDAASRSEGGMKIAAGTMSPGAAGAGPAGGARPTGGTRRNVLLALLAFLLSVAALWGPSLRDSAELATVRAAIANRDWPRAESLLSARLPAGPPPAGDRARRLSAEHRYLLGRVYRRQRRFAEADRCFSAAAELGWNRDDIDRQRLLKRAQTGDILAVEEELGRLLAAGGDDAFAEDCYEALAEGFIGSFRMADARECLDFWERWQPENPLPSYWMGVIEERYERPVVALERYAQALALNPRLYDARVRAARLELDTARLEDARRHFEECLAERPDDPAAVMGLADCLLRSGDLAAARELYHDALSTDLGKDQACSALTELGQMALEEGDFRRAASLLEEAVQIDPDGTRARLTFAGALLRIGDAEGARAQRDIAQRMAERQRRLAAVTHEALGKPDDPDLRAEAGTILLDQGFVKEGLGWLETALRIDPDHGPSHRVLADHFGATGDTQSEAHHRRLAGAAARPGSDAGRTNGTVEGPAGMKDGPKP